MLERIMARFIDTYHTRNSLFDSFDRVSETSLVLRWKNGDNMNDIAVYVGFIVKGANEPILITINNFDLPNFSGAHAAGVEACNQINNDDLVKFYIDEDEDAIAQASLFFNAYKIPCDFSPELVLTVATTVALAVDDAYPILQRAKFTRR